MFTVSALANLHPRPQNIFSVYNYFSRVDGNLIENNNAPSADTQKATTNSNANKLFGPSTISVAAGSLFAVGVFSIMLWGSRKYFPINDIDGDSESLSSASSSMLSSPPKE